MTELPSDGHLLRIYIDETDRNEGVALYEWIVRKAREHHLAGATVLRGIEGFGRSTRVHRANILELSESLPIVVEIVDTKEKIEAFLPIIDVAIKSGLVTLEKIEIKFYRTREAT